MQTSQICGRYFRANRPASYPGLSVFVEPGGQSVSWCQSGSLWLCEHSSPVAFALINTGALTRREMGGASRRFTGVTEDLVSGIVKRSYMRQQTDTDQLLLSCNCESSDDLFLFVIQPCTHPSSLSESSVHRSRWSVGGHQPLGLLFPPYLEISASFSLFFSSPVLFIAEEARRLKILSWFSTDIIGHPVSIHLEH